VRVAIAVASYGGDAAVLDRVQEAGTATLGEALTAVGVVDSGPAARCDPLRDALAEQFPHVDYIHHAGNLGAAGNLRERLRWARRMGAEAVLAVNADGRIDGDNARRMLECLERHELAAVYPTQVIGGATVDLSGRRRVPVLPSRTTLEQLRDRRPVPVRWGSSNGALYRLDAVMELDLDHIASLWHGWEDLAVGLGLDDHGHRQVLCTEARQSTASDQRRLARTRLVVSAKPAWTTYYGVRNLLLIGRRHPRLVVRVLLRVAREFVTITVRDRRRERYTMAMRGLVDGILGRSGQRIDPTG
jgi:glycosyltransferase involved in cell wall biosynthesis